MRKYLDSVLSKLGFPEDESEIIMQYYFNDNTEKNLDQFSITYVCAIARILYFIKQIANPRETTSEGYELKHFKLSIMTVRQLTLKQEDRFIIPYDFIAYYIFQDSDYYAYHDFEKAYEEIIGGDNHSYFEKLDLQEKLVPEDKKCIEKVFNKIKRNALLAIHQKQYILENIDQAQREVELLNEDIFTLTGTTELLQSQSSSMQEQTDSFINRLQNVTGTYVAILGIFATIIFAVVGGINLLGSAAEYIRYKKEFLLYVSVGVLTLSLIIYFLFSWIYRLRGHEGSSDNQQAHNGWLKKVELFFKNYGFFLFLSVLSGIAIYAFLSDDQKLNRPIGNIPSGYFEDAPFHYLGVWDRAPNEISTIRIDNKE